MAGRTWMWLLRECVEQITIERFGRTTYIHRPSSMRSDGSNTDQPTAARLRRAISGAVIASCCACLSGCAGSGDAQDRPNGESPPGPHLAFDTASMRSVFSDGVVGFSIQPATTGDMHVVCTLNGVPANSCLLDSTKGEIRFAGLASGSHEAAVEVTWNNKVSRAVQTIHIVRPSVVVFGATPAGISAALAAADSGATVAIVEPTAWVGGMMSGGLAKTDMGPRGHEVLGGLAAQFFERLRAAENSKGVCPGGCADLVDFEPQVAERVFEQMLGDSDVIVERESHLVGVHREGARIRSLTTSRGEIAGDVFIDASYEGDLVARAGVTSTVEREARESGTTPESLAVQEDHAGVQRYRLPLGLRIDPFKLPGDATSGTLPYLEPRPSPIPTEGDADRRVMAFTYRLCVTDDPTNRVAFSRPSNYDVHRYEAHARLAQAWTEAGADLAHTMFNPARTVLSKNRTDYKYDLNGGSTFSIDMTAPGLNQAYVEADEVERGRIRQHYRDYINGLLYTWQSDPRFGNLNQKVARFGFCADEFTGRGGWPHQLYVRVARRMRGAYVMNENDVMQNGRRPPITDIVGFGAYPIDMHTHRYMAAPVDWPDGTRREALTIEGFQIVHFPDDRPYPISYRSLTPRLDEAVNLLSPVALSATYVAYSSLRMEPTFMMLGESAGIAAALVAEQGIAVQALDYSNLRERLVARGQRVSH
jgi:hypothetical protein